MSKAKFVLNRQGVRELLRGEEMQAVLNAYAATVKSNCGDGFARDSHVGKNRANAMIYAETKEAVAKNYENNTLLKALKAGQ